MSKATLLCAILSRPGLGARYVDEAVKAPEELVDRGERVARVDVYKGWLEIDTFEDYERAWAEIKS